MNSRKPPWPAALIFIAGGVYAMTSRPADLLGVVFTVLFGAMMVITGVASLVAGIGDFLNRNRSRSQVIAERSRKRDEKRRVERKRPLWTIWSEGPPRLFLILHCALFILVGVYCAGTFVSDEIRSLRAMAWRETPCVIGESRVQALGGKGRPLFRPVVTYVYVGSDGVRREGSRLCFGDEAGASSYAAARVEANPPGAPRSCFVNPDDSSDAILFKESRADPTGLLGGLVFIGAGLFFLTKRSDPMRWR